MRLLCLIDRKEILPVVGATTAPTPCKKKSIDGRLPKSAINWKNNPSTETGVVFPTPFFIFFYFLGADTALYELPILRFLLETKNWKKYSQYTGMYQPLKK
jgi:hypothetical protein